MMRHLMTFAVREDGAVLVDLDKDYIASEGVEAASAKFKAARNMAIEMYDSFRQGQIDELMDIVTGTVTAESVGDH